MRVTPPRRLAGLTAVCLAGLVGCGTTVQDSSVGTGQLPGASPAEGSLTGPAGAPGQPTSAGPASVPGSAATPGQSGATGSGPTSSATGPVAVGGSTQSGTSALPATGTGYTAHTLFLGVTTENDAQATLKAVGFSSGSLGDEQEMAKAVIADVNSHGGVLGRKIVPVFHDVNTMETSTNPEAAAQSACAAFTQDAHVAAVMDLALNSMDFEQCIIQHHAFVETDGLTFMDRAYVRSLVPNFFSLTSPLAEDLIPTFLSRLSALGYFSPWDVINARPGKAPVKVGLFYLDEPAPTRAFNDIAARLTAMGYPVVRYAYSRQDSSYQNAVLQFKAAGVTHIIGDNASYVGLMTETQAQHYYPRYAMTSYNGGTLEQQAVPAKALSGALGVGWVPSVDVDAQRDPGPTGPAYTQCVHVMKQHGQDVSSRGALANALGICDGIEVLVQSMRAGGGFDGAHITAGRATFSFDAAATFSGTHNQGSIAIPSAVRDYGYRTSCSCFTYLSRTNYELR